MNLNQNTFQQNATRLNVSRSKFHLPFKWTGSFNASQIVPVFSYSDVLPGDTFKVDMSAVIRSTTPVGPTMDDAFVDFYFFFVPHKLALGREMFSPSVASSNYSWEAFIGAQYGTLNVPTPASNTILKMSMKTRTAGTYADALGLPGTSTAYDISALEPLAYAKVWNDYFRDPNTQNPIYASVSGGKCVLSNWESSATSNVYDLKLLNACRNHGYFGSCLPWPQRNTTSITTPLGVKAEVKTGPVNSFGDTSQYSLLWQNSATGTTVGYQLLLGQNDLGQTITDDEGAFTWGEVRLRPSNLYADLTTATASSINELRLAFQTQKYYEELARAGSRYGELKAGFFCTDDSDATDKVEYLGGKRIPLNTTQVCSTNGTDTGNTGAFSLTSDADHYFTKSFKDWGTLLCVGVVRTRDSFYQGLDKRYTRFNRLDYYWPTFANIGEVGVSKGEIYKTGASTDDEIFGYQEAWAEYRYLSDKVTGVVLPTNATYKYWTYAHNFASTPTLSDYIQGTYVNNVDQTLKAGSTSSGFQFLAQCYFNIEAIRPMPTYSIPGLIDHN